MAKYISKTQKIWEKEDDKDPMSLLNMARKYLRWREVHNYSSFKHTQYNLGIFLTWCYESEITVLTDVTKEIMNSYKIHLSQRIGVKTNKVLSFEEQNRILSTICSFFTWATKAEYFEVSPCEEIRYYKRNQRLPRNILNVEEVERVLNQADITTAKGIRDRAIMEVLYSSGIRRWEISRLKVQHVDLARGFLLVVEGKGKKDRLIPIGERAVKWLTKYLQEVRSQIIRKPTEDTLFLSVHGKALVSPNRYNALVREYMDAAKINKVGACHLFRHAMATAMLENGADIRYIQECLGHTELATTDIYTRVTIGNLKNVHNQTHPTSNDQSIINCENTKPRPRPSNTKTKEEPELHTFWQENQHHIIVSLARNFLDSMESKGHKKSYVVSTYFYLRKFLEWCLERELLTPEMIDRKVLNLFENYLYYNKRTAKNQLLTVSSRQKYIFAIKIFMRWLLEKKHISKNLAENIEPPKSAKQIPRNIPSPEEIEEIMSLPDTSTTIGIRDRTIMEVLYSTGMRRGEINGLELNDINITKQTVHIRNTKSNKDRVVPMGTRAINWVQEYLDKARIHLLKEETKTLFLSVNGKPFSRDSVSEIIWNYLKKAGLYKQRGACHIFRHAMATHMLSKGADIRHIKEILGHAKLSTTEIYTKVSIDKLKEVHTKTHPATMTPTKTKQVIDELDQ